LLGVLYAALGASTFALNNVGMRRRVMTGSVLQAMATTGPIGGLSFPVMGRGPRCHTPWRRASSARASSITRGMNISADGHCRYFKPNWSMLLPLALDVDAVGKT